MCFFFKFFVVYSSDIGSMIAIIGDSFASRGDIWPISIRLPGDVAWSQAAGEYIHIYIYILQNQSSIYVFMSNMCMQAPSSVDEIRHTHVHDLMGKSPLYSEQTSHRMHDHMNSNISETI